MEVIGTAGAIVSIIDVVTRSISTLADFGKRIKAANLTLTMLLGQLGTVRTALDQVLALIKEGLKDQEQHYLLVMNLGDTIKCCNLLVRLIDEQVSNLEYNENNLLDFESKINLVLESKGTEQCLTQLDRQINALNLLITTFQCRTLLQQKAFMEVRTTQQVFQQVKDDSSSLLVLCDSESFITARTRTTTATSRFSLNFVFDAELLQHKAYKSTLRSLMRRTRSRSSPQAARDGVIRTASDMKAAKASSYIDQLLQTDARQLHSESNPRRKRQLQPNRIESKEYKTHVRAMKLGRPNSNGGQLSPDVKEAIRWTMSLPDLTQRCYVSAEDLMDDLERILQYDFMPTDLDYLRWSRQLSPTTGVQEVVLNKGQLKLRIMSTSGQWSESKKWIHHFENVTSVIFVVDLTHYDEYPLVDATQNRLMEHLILFNSVANSEWFKRSSILLLLSNVAEFKAKLSTHPLENVFPEYSGGNDVDRAAKYILWRFNQVNKQNLSIHSHLVDFNDPNILRLVFASIEQTLMENTLGSLDII
ncbi:hypothetical protein EPUS_00652 [Endocarpon pusillum Z07020]|uniref:Uncharacterized protein n=1 Tax=Endocarpon pusillum (strain Z07020 / HMAS-L-300199) TaxID=1263415 RepID=U1GHT8_ENDPU|nr:uncharacterized protein EPUS_00652 [Endocarpon pusillum Z07020]ERF71663.1 hypothetical protein EPUS_00652 [Endocarpon pusillum Z07020]